MSERKTHYNPPATREEMDQRRIDRQVARERNDAKQLKRFGAGVAAATVLFGGYQATDKLTYDDIGTASATVERGGTAIGAVEDAVAELAEQHNIDPASISGVVKTGQEIGSTMPGQVVTIDLEENIFGKVRVTPHEQEDQ